MFDFIAAAENLPFAVAIGVMLGLTLLEVLMVTMGGSLFGALDHADIDGPDADLDLDSDAQNLEAISSSSDSHVIGRILGWFAIGRVPLLAVIIAFLTTFGLSGLILQSLWAGITGVLLPASLASVPALVGSALMTRWAAHGLARLIPSNETSAVSTESFVGRVAVITLGSASHGQPAQAKLQDEHGQTHYLMVEPDQADIVFDQGDHVLLIDRAAGVFKGIPNKSDALIDQ